MKDNLKKPGWKSYFSKAKIFLIFSIVFALVLAALAPTINSNLIKNRDDVSEDKYNREDDGEYKKTGYDEETRAHASFYWKPRFPDTGETITFRSNSYATNGHISNEKWHFEDGDIDYGRIATYTYYKKGSYKVTLEVTAYGSYGSFDWNLKTIIIKVGEDPFPRITCTPESPSPGEEVTLDSSKSTDPDGKIVSYKWSYYSIDNPKNVTEIGNDQIIHHIWKESGIYNVVLFIEDDKGNNNTFEKTIHVSILKIESFDTFSRGLNLKISNHGNITANNVRWSLKIFRYSPLKMFSKCLYQKSGTILGIYSGDHEKIELKDIRRKFCKIELVVNVEADNAVVVSRLFYGLIFGKYIYLSEKNFVNPYWLALFIGLNIALLLYIL